MFGKKASIPGRIAIVSYLTNIYYLHLSLIEQVKAHNRELRKTDRELVRDRHRLETEEQRIVRLESFQFKLYIEFLFSR